LGFIQLDDLKTEKGVVHLWMPDSVSFFLSWQNFAKKENFQIQKRKCDFGAFQSPEIRKFNVKIARFLYLVFIV
jgi:hypothetical protein